MHGLNWIIHWKYRKNGKYENIQSRNFNPTWTQLKKLLRHCIVRKLSYKLNSMKRLVLWKFLYFFLLCPYIHIQSRNYRFSIKYFTTKNDETFLNQQRNFPLFSTLPSSLLSSCGPPGPILDKHINVWMNLACKLNQTKPGFVFSLLYQRLNGEIREIIRWRSPVIHYRACACL